MTDAHTRSGRPARRGSTRRASAPGALGRRAAACATAILAVVIVALAVLKPAVTSASWGDGEYAKAGFTAVTEVPKVANLTCSPQSSGILGAFSAIELTWNSAGPNYHYRIGGTNSNDGIYTPFSSTDLSIADNGDGTLSTTISKGLLNGLIAGLLGGTSFYSVQAFAGDWYGDWADPVTLTSPLLGSVLGGQCTPES